MEIENKDDVLFIGRRNPAPGKRTSPDIYIRRGNHDTLPQLDDLARNTTEEALIRLITRFAGIAEMKTGRSPAREGHYKRLFDMRCFSASKSRTKLRVAIGSSIAKAINLYRRRSRIRFPTFSAPLMRSTFSGRTNSTMPWSRYANWKPSVPLWRTVRPDRTCAFGALFWMHAVSDLSTGL